MTVKYCSLSFVTKCENGQGVCVLVNGTVHTVFKCEVINSEHRFVDRTVYDIKVFLGMHTSLSKEC